MSCCGQKRAALTKATAARTQIQPYTQPVPVQTATQPNGAGTVALHYLGAAAISLRGSSSGRVYYFDKTGAIVIVHEHDVDALLRTQLFARADG